MLLNEKHADFDIAKIVLGSLPKNTEVVIRSKSIGYDGAGKLSVSQIGSSKIVFHFLKQAEKLSGQSWEAVKPIAITLSREDCNMTILSSGGIKLSITRQDVELLILDEHAKSEVPWQFLALPPRTFDPHLN